MRNYFVFNGIKSSDYGVFISGGGTFGAPERDIEVIEIKGRDGVLTMDNGRFLAQEFSYPAFILRDFDTNIEGFRNALMAQRGLQRLTDTYHPGEFYRAYYEAGLEADVLQTLRQGSFELTFTRDPRRFLLSGEEVTALTASGTLTNPSRFASKPKLRVYGTGNVGVGSGTITITYADGYTDIDCEIQEAFKGTSSCNQYVQLSGQEYPTLSPGQNGITLGSGITRVEITPRWFIL